MKSISYNQILKFIFSSLLVLLFLMIPDFIFSFINPHFKVCFNFDKLGVILILSMIMVTLKNLKFLIGFIVIFGIMQIIQFCNMAYFGVYITSYALQFIFWEARDIVTEAGAVWYKYLYVPFVIIIPYFILIYGLKKYNSQRVTFKSSYLFFILFFVYFLYKATTPVGIFQMLFKNTCYSTYNTINSFSGFLGNVLPQSLFGDAKNNDFSPYEISKTAEDNQRPMNVIFVVGESINARNMSLLGYERDTTPELIKYASEDSNFVYKNAWGAAVNTLISLPMIYNIQVNPKNFQKLVKKDSNLLKLAKENNFKVTYIELQNAEVFRKTSLSDYDKLFVYDAEKDIEFKGESDYLKYALEQIKLEGRNFIIIHKRNIHSPYEYNYKHDNNKFEVFSDSSSEENKRRDLYDNAMRYEDALIKQILNYAKSSKEETYFYYTSDHGEGLGENGVWGHGHLTREDLEVPFFFTMFNVKDDAYLEQIKNKFYPCAYDIGMLVAQKLGYKIKVPDENMNVCQINGRDSMGRAGVFKVTKDDANKTMQFEKLL